MFRKLLLILTVAGLLTGAGLSTAQDTGSAAIVEFVNAATGGITVSVSVDSKPDSATLEFTDVITMNLEPGLHTLRLSATGAGGASGAIGDPIKLNLRAGDQHFIYVLWTTAERQALAAKDINVMAASRRASDDLTYIAVNALPGAPTGQIMIDGKAYGDPIAYGDYAVAQVPSANYNSVEYVDAAHPTTVLMDLGAFFVEPKLNYIQVVLGRYPGELGRDYGLVSPDLRARANAWDFLAAFNRHTVGTSIFPESYLYQHDDWKFTIFLKAVEDAGLKDLLTGSETLTVFPPTDAAFNRLPAGQLKALLADPNAMKTLVENHLMQPMIHDLDALIGSPRAMMGGAKPVVSVSDAGIYVIDGEVTGYDSGYSVTNGRVFPLDRVLMSTVAPVTGISI